ncbi:MAG: LAGLIDADG family homing endonuclease, partial [Candidatus Lokiarchaeota archaeon]
MQESKRELKKGYISAINGSLIHIKGFQGQNFQEHVRLHDLVKVDKQNIMGEIIQIYSKYVAAQCFENTDNLKLYQEVTYLNEPLSMELGPGLLSNVFDGIQRPLDKIFEKAKSGFLERGVEIPSLSRTKKWHFKPTKKEGEKVVSGDVVGIVQETPAITHYIMIPNGISGEISYIVEEGEYTVTENIYNIKTEKDEKKFDMIQKWPVTKNRPFSKKLSPTRPLITGQRVVDLLFPVAKGGTVAVPGGFGTGKCVVGDTPVLLSNGSLVEIKKLYKKYKKNDGEININSREETLIRIQNDLEVLSLNSINFKPQKATHIYHGKTNQIIKIGTRTGRKIRLTPIHKLHVFDGNKILTKMAKDLAENDYILVPRKIKINEQSISFSAYDMDDSLRVYDEYALEKMRNLLDKIYKTNTKKEIAKKLNIKYNQLQQYWNATNKPPIKFFKKVSQVFKEDPIKISLIKAERQSKPFKIPQNLTPELSEWLGLFVADGHIKGTHGGIFLYNTSKQILERFKKLSEVIFNLEVSYGGDSDERTPYMVIRNTSLRKFLYML